MTDLFGENEEWVEMPEFVQKKQKPYSKIIIRFRNKSDMDEFSNTIGQKLTPKTKSIWYPQLIRGINSNKVWVDES